MNTKLSKFLLSIVKSNFNYLNLSQQKNLADLIFAFFFNTSFALWDIASGLSGEISTKQKNKRLIYFLDSFEIDVRFWKSVLLTVFSLPGFKWKKRKVLTLALDATTLKGDYWMLAVTISYKGRGIPILIKSWEGVHDKYNYWARVEETLRDLKEIIPSKFKYEVVADRGFQGDVLFSLFEKLGMSYIIRVNDCYRVQVDKNGTYIQLSLFKDGFYPIENFGVKKKTKGMNLVVNTNVENPDTPRWYLSTNISETAHEIVSKYKQRFWIEESFKDLKSKLHWEKYTKKIPTNGRLEKCIAISSLSYSIQMGIGKELNMSDSEMKITSVFNKFRQTFRRGTKELENIVNKFSIYFSIYVKRYQILFSPNFG